MSTGAWTSDGRWVSHSIGCWADTEWAEWQRIAQLTGKSTNAWIRWACNEVAKLERSELREREERENAGVPA